MQDVVVRHWQDGDDPKVSQLFDRVERWLSDDAYARKFDDEGLKPEGILVAEDGDRIVGHLMGTRTQIYCEGRPQTFGTLGQVMVDRDYQGRGIGKTLLDRILQYHRRDQCRGVILWTQTSRVPAYPMYCKAGFESVVRRAVWKVAPVGGSESWTVEPCHETFRPQLEAIRQEWMRVCFPVGPSNLQPEGGDCYVVHRNGECIGYVHIGERDGAPFLSRAVALPTHTQSMCDALLGHLKVQGHVQVTWLTAIGSFWDEALRQRGYTEVRETGDVRMCLSIGETIDIAGLRPEFEGCFTW